MVNSITPTTLESTILIGFSDIYLIKNLTVIQTPICK